MLQKMNCSVQLKHEADEDMATEGRVVVLAEDGTELARHDSAMTNGNYYERPQLFEAMASDVAGALNSAPSAKAPSSTPGPVQSATAA